jgi:hypothetical protein
MILIDEYLAMRVLGGTWPEGLPDNDDQALTASRHWRLLQRIHAPGTGQLSQRLAALSAMDLAVVRHPHPEILQVLDPRPMLDDAARLAAAYGGGLLIAESLAAALVHGRSLYFGTDRNVGRVLATAADELGIGIHVLAS